MSEYTACVMCAREAGHGYLCAGHYSRLAAMLRDIEDEASALDARPSMAIRVGNGKGSLASERTPVRLDVLVHNDPRSRPAGTRYPGPSCPSCWHDSCTEIRAWIDAFDAHATETLSILDVLGSWARIVREERDLNVSGAATITGERDLLTRQLDWCARQDWVDEMYDDLRKLVGQLRAVNGTLTEKPVGHCYLPTIEGDGICRGPIWIDTIAGHAHCGKCRQTWDGPQLAMLRFELDEQRAELLRPKTADGRPMLTPEELVAQGIVSTVSNVRVMAHRRRIVSTNGHYDPDAFAERGKISA